MKLDDIRKYHGQLVSDLRKKEETLFNDTIQTIFDLYPKLNCFVLHGCHRYYDGDGSPYLIEFNLGRHRAPKVGPSDEMIYPLPNLDEINEDSRYFLETGEDLVKAIFEHEQFLPYLNHEFLYELYSNHGKIEQYETDHDEAGVYHRNKKFIRKYWSLKNISEIHNIESIFNLFDDWAEDEYGSFIALVSRDGDSFSIQKFDSDDRY